MNYRAYIFSIAVGLTQVGLTQAAEALPPAIQQALQRAKIPASALSLVVMPLDGRASTMLHQADVPVNPASLMKIVTTYSALELLGVAYQWPTELRSNVAPVNGVLTGDVYLKGFGDPKLTMERVWLLLRDLKAAGVREIHGDLVLDRSFFVLGAEPAGFDDESNSAERPFLVGPDALLMNFKSVRLQLNTGASSVSASIDPPLPEVRIDNRLQISPAADCSQWASKLDIQLDEASGPRVLLTGRMPSGCSGERYLSVLNHPDYTASLIRMLWKEAGGSWQGKVRLAETPADARLLVTTRSPELPLLLRDINKYSNNLMARQVFLTLGALQGTSADGADSASRANAVIRRWLASKGHQYPELVLENGSGLSRNERISARHLGELLGEAGRGALAAEFIATLPVVAQDGTMKKRLNKEPMAGQAHIKTGTLRGVRAVAGYVRGKEGDTRVVVAILNHPRAGEGSGVLDEVLRYVFAMNVTAK